MRLFALLLLLIYTATAALAFHNWPIFIELNDLSLGFTSIQAPIGLVMLGTLIFITALFLMNVVYMQSTAILETRRYTRELEASRELVNKTEKSRFTELKNSFEIELAKQSARNEEIKTELFERSDLMESNFRTMIEQMENTLDAYIGELEDRLERQKLLPPVSN